eukprot:scaffold842_cov227-Pinguiococcus_pyrenoidosus.AAC.9
MQEEEDKEEEEKSKSFYKARATRTGWSLDRSQRDSPTERQRLLVPLESPRGFVRSRRGWPEI